MIYFICNLLYMYVLHANLNENSVKQIEQDKNK